MTVQHAKFHIGQVVRHRFYPFRGVVFDVDPEFANTEDWWLAIPDHIRPRKDQPYYHLLAENEETTYIAYVSEQNLLPDETGKPVAHPQISEFFTGQQDGVYVSRSVERH
jgi:heat shock protein HspQ